MSITSAAGRTVLHMVFALLFALAAFTFAARARTAWEVGDRGRLVLSVLAALGAVSLSARSFQKARRGGGPT
jgi:hypothetical protein